ncbi:MAG: hypothetical protein JW717_12570 [Marinilabiliaceae bacterium]|nr:hypothetical protein [Marinilabiliaceae bacterium]
MNKRYVIILVGLIVSINLSAQKNSESLKTLQSEELMKINFSDSLVSGFKLLSTDSLSWCKYSKATEHGKREYVRITILKNGGELVDGEPIENQDLNEGDLEPGIEKSNINIGGEQQKNMEAQQKEIEALKEKVNQ